MPVPKVGKVTAQTTLSGVGSIPTFPNMEIFKTQTDSDMSIISWDPVSGEPTRIEWWSNKISRQYKAVTTYIYNGAGVLTGSSNAIEER